MSTPRWGDSDSSDDDDDGAQGPAVISVAAWKDVQAAAEADTVSAPPSRPPPPPPNAWRARGGTGHASNGGRGGGRGRSAASVSASASSSAGGTRTQNSFRDSQKGGRGPSAQNYRQDSQNSNRDHFGGRGGGGGRNARHHQNTQRQPDWRQTAKESSILHNQTGPVDGSSWMAQRRARQQEQHAAEQAKAEERRQQAAEEAKHRRSSQLQALKQAMASIEKEKEAEAPISSLQAAVQHGQDPKAVRRPSEASSSSSAKHAQQHPTRILARPKESQHHNATASTADTIHHSPKPKQEAEIPRQDSWRRGEPLPGRKSPPNSPPRVIAKPAALQPAPAAKEYHIEIGATATTNSSGTPSTLPVTQKLPDGSIRIIRGKSTKMQADGAPATTATNEAVASKALSPQQESTTSHNDDDEKSNASYSTKGSGGRGRGRHSQRHGGGRRGGGGRHHHNGRRGGRDDHPHRARGGGRGAHGNRDASVAHGRESGRRGGHGRGRGGRGRNNPPGRGGNNRSDSNKDNTKQEKGGHAFHIEIG